MLKLLVPILLLTYSCGKDPKKSFNFTKEKNSFVSKGNQNEYRVEFYKDENAEGLYLLNKKENQVAIKLVKLCSKEKAALKLIKTATCGCPGEKEMIELVTAKTETGFKECYSGVFEIPLKSKKTYRFTLKEGDETHTLDL